MSFLDLPQEVLLVLIERLPDRTLISLSLTCRILSRYAGRTIEQRKHKDQEYTGRYRRLEMANSWHRESRWRHPLEIMFDIRHDGIIAKYVDELEFSPAATDLHSPDEPLTEDQEAKLVECNYFEEEVDNLIFLSPEENQRWKTAVREGGRNASFVLLLSLCVRATKLTLDDIETLPAYLNRAIDYLDQQYRRAATSTDEGDASSGSHQLFPRLKTLLFSHRNTQFGISLEGDFSVLAIPTLDTLKLHCIGKDEDDDDNWTWPAGRTGLAREVEAFDCRFSPRSFFKFVAGLPRLELLNWHDRCDFYFGDECESVVEFAEQFRERAKHLLEERSLVVTIPGGYALRIQKSVETVEV